MIVIGDRAGRRARWPPAAARQPRRAPRRAVRRRRGRSPVPAVPEPVRHSRSAHVNERPFSYRALFAVVYTTSVSSVYFALGVVAHRANGLTPLVFLAGGIFFQLTAMTYAEGASLHPERGGSAVFARYAFNELVSFIAGWAIVLDYTILLAVTALTSRAIWPRSGRRSATAALQIAVAFARDRVRRVRQPDRRQRHGRCAAGSRSPSPTWCLQAAVIVLGLALAFHPHHLTRDDPSRDRADVVRPRVRVPDRRDRVHRPRGGGQPGRRGRRRACGRCKRLVVPGSAVIVLIYVGIAVVGIARAPGPQRRQRARRDSTSTRRCWGWSRRSGRSGSPTCSSTRSRSGARSGWRRPRAPRCSASRASGYSLATNRQIPSAIGRLSTRWGTPFVVIGAAAMAAAALVHAARTSSCWSGSTRSARCSRSRSPTSR